METKVAATLAVVLLTAISAFGEMIVINEADADQVSTDAAEFVELFGAADTSLDGLVLVFFDGGDDASYLSFDLDGLATDANGYFLVGNSGVSPAPGLTFPGSSLQNGADAVALYTGNAIDFPNDTPATTTNLLDALAYDSNEPDDKDLLIALGLTEQINEGGADGDATDKSISRIPNGTGKFVATTEITPGAENAVPEPASAMFALLGMLGILIRRRA